MQKKKPTTHSHFSSGLTVVDSDRQFMHKRFFHSKLPGEDEQMGYSYVIYEGMESPFISTPLNVPRKPAGHFWQTFAPLLGERRSHYRHLLYPYALNSTFHPQLLKVTESHKANKENPDHQPWWQGHQHRYNETCKVYRNKQEYYCDKCRHFTPRANDWSLRQPELTPKCSGFYFISYQPCCLPTMFL